MEMYLTVLLMDSFCFSLSQLWCVRGGHRENYYSIVITLIYYLLSPGFWWFRWRMFCHAPLTDLSLLFLKPLPMFLYHFVSFLCQYILSLPHTEASDPGDSSGDRPAPALLGHPHRAARERAFQGLPQRHALPELLCGWSAVPTGQLPSVPVGLRAGQCQCGAAGGGGRAAQPGTRHQFRWVKERVWGLCSSTKQKWCDDDNNDDGLDGNGWWCWVWLKHLKKRCSSAGENIQSLSWKQALFCQCKYVLHWETIS